MKPNEDQLCEAFADALRDNPAFRVFVLEQTKFRSEIPGIRLLDREQMAIRPRKRWWRHWWCHVPELRKDRETDIFAVFEHAVDLKRFALHIECKRDVSRFTDGQAGAYEPRARHMLGRPAYLSYSAYDTILIAPKAFALRYPEDRACFSCFISFEEIAAHVPLFRTA